MRTFGILVRGRDQPVVVHAEGAREALLAWIADEYGSIGAPHWLGHGTMVDVSDAHGNVARYEMVGQDARKV